jgi:hypothetical protein
MWEESLNFPIPQGGGGMWEERVICGLKFPIPQSFFISYSDIRVCICLLISFLFQYVFVSPASFFVDWVNYGRESSLAVKLVPVVAKSLRFKVARTHFTPNSRTSTVQFIASQLLRYPRTAHVLEPDNKPVTY